MEANAWKYKLAPGEYVCMHVCMYACKEMHVACALQAAKGPREEHRVEKDGGVLQMQRTYSKKELYIKNNAFKLKVAN